MPKKDLYIELCKSSELLLPKQDRSTVLQALRQTIPEADLRVYFLLSFGESLPLDKLYAKAARLKMTPAEVDEALDRLYREFFVLRYHKPDGLHYERCPLTMTAEQQVRAKKGTALGKLYADYWIRLTVDTVKVLPTHTPYLRVMPVEATIQTGARAVEIPVRAALPDPRQVVPLDVVSALVQNQRVIGVAECYCRAMKDFQGEHCQKPRQTCFVFNEFAESLIERGIARRLELDEALTILVQAERAGLVHNADNFQGQIRAICNCCSCCCPGLQAARRGQKNVQAVSRYMVAFEADRCEHDYACLEACPIAAITLDGGDPKIDLELCFGCGLCVSACPSGALSMVVRSKAPGVPKSSKELNGRLMREAVIGLAINTLTGRKAG
jgi:Pyruvate/2-oxoacid:ferredoxin oxidoreductase delta subunit